VADWINTIVQGLLLGGLYALFALGLSLVFGVMRLVNIAHGDLILLAAFLAIVITSVLGLHPFLSLAILVPLMFVLGYVLQRGLLNFTLGRDILPPLLVTFGLSILVQNGLLEVFSADSRSLPGGGIETASFQLTEHLAVGTLPLIIFATALVLTAGLQLFFARTALGRAFRATSDDQQAAQLMGIDNRHIYALATAVAFATIAVSGVFLALRTTIAPTDGPAQLLYGFEAVIIGGLGSIWGTFAGGMILGVAQAIGFRVDPGWGVLAGHVAFLAVLLFKPTGLLGKGN
jgi:branched-chain amino acid transport system permease protein